MGWLRIHFNDSFKRGELYITTTPVSIEYCVSESSFYNIFFLCLGLQSSFRMRIGQTPNLFNSTSFSSKRYHYHDNDKDKDDDDDDDAMMMTMTIIIKTMILTMMNIGEIRMDPHTSTVNGIIANMSKFNVMVLVIHFGGRSLGWTCRVLC